MEPSEIKVQLVDDDPDILEFDRADPDPASYGVADPDLNFSFKATGSVSPFWGGGYKCCLPCNNYLIAKNTDITHILIKEKSWGFKVAA